MTSYKKWIIVTYAVVTTLFDVSLSALAYFRISMGMYGYEYALTTFVAIAMVTTVAGLRVRDL